MSKTYIFEGTEVKKTGRTATKQIKMAGGKLRELMLEEISPVSTDEFPWTKWISPDQLYEVNNE